jgi:glycosyltransferase involved in cell wall biosynthesis
MRVALVNLTTTTQVGGVESFVLRLAHSLAASGVQVTLFGGTPHVSRDIAPDDIPLETSAYVSRDTFRRVPLLNRQYGLTKLFERLSYAPGAVDALVTGAFDIIHIHKPFDFPLAAWVRRRTGARIIYSSHGRDFYPGDQRFLGAIDAMTACSSFNAREVAARYGRMPAVIFNGIDSDHFRPLTDDGGWRERLHLGREPLVLWAGRLVRWKGTVDALRAVALAAPCVHLAIAGRGPEERRLREAAASLGIADRVRFTGTVSQADLPQLYATADAVVGTSFANETFGMVLAEASACARPVIATDFGGFPEVVRDNETGLLVPPRDPAALALAIQRIIEHPARANQMGEAGRDFVTAQFAWPVVTARVLRVYREALGAD